MDYRVLIVEAFMSDNLHRQLSLSEIAREVNLSSSRLRHLFVLETGVSPHRHLRLLRLNRARHLLENSWLTVMQIGLQVGMPDRSHFEREFKKVYSVTPGQYRTAARYSRLLHTSAPTSSQNGHVTATSAAQ